MSAALREAIRGAHTAAEAAIAMSEYGGAEDSRAADRASKTALDHALKLADEMTAELEKAHSAIRRAARELRGQAGLYTLGPGNGQRVAELLISDASKVAAELLAGAGL
ncbi:hypothetical protein [Amycolatopsis sp. NPDC003731]